MSDTPHLPTSNPLWLMTTAVAALVAVIAVGAWFYKDQERGLRDQANINLTTISRLKVEQIATWRSERLDDAQRISQAEEVARTLAAWQRNPSAENTLAVRRTFQPMKSDGNYRDVLFVSTDGRVLLRMSDANTSPQPELLAAITEAITSGTPQMTNPHSTQDGSYAHLDVVAPVFEGAGPEAKPLGAIVLQALASDYLLPLIETWPTPSTTAETLLAVRDGTWVRFLNEVRHPRGGAADLSLPITQTDAPAVMAVLGRTGVVEGRDYRDQPVLAFIGRIPDSPWYIVAKIDKSEALAAWRARSVYIVLLVLALGLVVGLGTLVFAQRSRYAQVTAMLVAERAKLKAEDELRSLNQSLERIVEERTKELSAANEELGATNEELHITSEDLTAVNEELRASNEELADASAAKTRFLRSMSHELRTPLNSVIGFSGTMLQGLAGEVSDEQRRQLQMISHAGHHLLDLINDILDLSVIEAGKMEIHTERFDISSLAREVLESVESAAEAKGLELRLEGADTQLIVASDQVRVRQILLNLLGNAVKFTDAGSVTVRIDGSHPHLVRLSVADTGPGIPAEEREHIFGEFNQRELHTLRQIEGTGLGLAISRGIATLLGATIELTSRDGGGSTFTLVLPIAY